MTVLGEARSATNERGPGRSARASLRRIVPGFRQNRKGTGRSFSVTRPWARVDLERFIPRLTPPGWAPARRDPARRFLNDVPDRLFGPGPGRRLDGPVLA